MSQGPRERGKPLGYQWQKQFVSSVGQMLLEHPQLQWYYHYFLPEGHCILSTISVHVSTVLPCPPCMIREQKTLLIKYDKSFSKSLRYRTVYITGLHSAQKEQMRRNQSIG
jgi:hypothetical protein